MEQIKKVLQKRKLDVHKLAELSGIQERFINALIQGKVEELPAIPYVRGYILRIADILKLNGKELWKDFKEQNLKKPGIKDRLPANRFEVKNFRRFFGVLLLFFLLMFFLITQASQLINNSLKLCLASPLIGSDRVVVNQPIFTIRGKISPNARLLINGEEVFSNQNGEFYKEILLEPGINPIRFNLKNFLGRTKTITKQVYYLPDVEI